MKKSITDEKNGLDYTLCGEVYLPNLMVVGSNYTIGRWGKMHKRWLKESHPAIYTSLLTNCKLNEHLHNIDVSAENQYEILMKQLKESQEITEQLKASDMMAWVQAMNNIENQVREIICNDIIYCIN